MKRYIKISNIIFSALMLFFLVGTLYQGFMLKAKQGTATEDIQRSALEQQLPNMQPSNGNHFGSIYTLDGKPMLSFSSDTGEEVEKRTDENKIYFASEECYAPVVGFSENTNAAFGLLRDAKSILLANADYSNINSVTGDSIITTIVSAAQQTAYEQIQEYADAAIAVVYRDGAILVDAGSIGARFEDYLYDYTAYQRAVDAEENGKETEDVAEPVLYDYKDAVAENLVGSSFKPIVARTMLLHDAEFSEEYSLRNSDFDDISNMEMNGFPLQNWECSANNPEAQLKASYEYLDADGVYHRSLDLAGALVNSSNTYFFRHAYHMGMEKLLTALNEDFHLNTVLNTGTIKLEKLGGAGVYSVGGEDFLLRLPYGQAAGISPIRMASAYNLMATGHFYAPFNIAQVRTPAGEIIFSTTPQELEEYSFHDQLCETLEEDILIQALQKTFWSYCKSTEDSYHKTLLEFDKELLNSGRLLAKSGTAITANESGENRTMALTLLNEEKNDVECTAFISINAIPVDVITNDALIQKLLMVLNALGVLK